MFHGLKKSLERMLFGVVTAAVVISAGGWAVVSGTVTGLWRSSGAVVMAHQNDPPDQDEMMKKWMEMATPGSQHEFLKQMEGKWDCTMKMWMDPSQPAMESKGTATMTMVLGGRWLKQEYHGEMMGQPFDGEGMTGYDNFRKKFVGTWMDTTTTAMLTNSGFLDQTGKVLTTYGTMDDCTTGQCDAPMKEVLTVVDPDTIHFEIHDLRIVPGQTKVMEMTYKRHKDDMMGH